MERLNVMSGILAFSFPCLIGAGITLPGNIKAEVVIQHDSLIHFQRIDSQLTADSVAQRFDRLILPQSFINK